MSDQQLHLFVAAADAGPERPPLRHRLRVTKDIRFSSESVEWYTPLWILERVIAVLGEIDLDPASNSQESPNVPARRHFTRADDGLAQSWLVDGQPSRVFLNPPYGRTLPLWIDKLLAEGEAGHVREAILLVHARTDTAWWRRVADWTVCFIGKRLRFSEKQGTAGMPSALLYRGPNSDRFVEVHAPIGACYQRIETPGETARLWDVVEAHWTATRMARLGPAGWPMREASDRVRELDQWAQATEAGAARWQRVREATG